MTNIEELAQACDCLKNICKIAEANGQQYYYDCLYEIECEECKYFTCKNNFTNEHMEKIFDLLGSIGTLCYDHKGKYHVFSLNGVCYSHTNRYEALCGLCLKLINNLYFSDFRQSIKEILA